MQSKQLTQFLGTLMKRHGLSVSYIDGYNSTLEYCNFICAKHGEFVNKPYNVVHQGSNGCKECGYERRHKRNASKLYGVGINDWDDRVSTSIVDKIAEYQMWKDLLKRIYSKKYQNKSPNYVGCTVDEKWLSLKAFINDVSILKNYEKGLYNGWCLDKDILKNSNKHYSLENCCFVPPKVNSNFKKLNKVTELPCGVYIHSRSGRYCCDITVDSKTIYLGSYDTAEEAFLIRKAAKQKEMSLLADKYIDELDGGVIYKLKNYDYDYNGNVITPDFKENQSVPSK